jgi:hypothetical protein
MSFSISLHFGWPSSTAGTRGRHRAAERVPPLTHHERVLERTESSTGSVVATDQALLLGNRGGTWRRIAWAEIASAGWSHSDHCLILRLWASGDHPYRNVRVAAHERLAAIARERVQFQRLLCVPVELDNAITGHVIAVRDGDDVRWHVVADASLDSPALQRACARAISEIRSLAGI